MPLVTHVDHSEHSVQVVVTEWGVADLRGKDAKERAQLIINHCAHPDYRDELQTYIDTAKEGHSLESLTNAFAMHRQFLKTGDMRGTQWNQALVQPISELERRAEVVSRQLVFDFVNTAPYGGASDRARFPVRDRIHWRFWMVGFPACQLLPRQWG